MDEWRRHVERHAPDKGYPPTPSSDAFTRCYRRAYEALTRSEEAAQIVDDPVLSTYLKEGGVRQKGDL